MIMFSSLLIFLNVNLYSFRRFIHLIEMDSCVVVLIVCSFFTFSACTNRRLNHSINCFSKVFSNGSSYSLDTPYVQSLLGTTASVDFYALSPESEIKRNIESFYTGIHEQKRLDGTVIQGLLHGLLIYKNSNTIWNSAVITVVRE